MLSAIPFTLALFGAPATPASTLSPLARAEVDVGPDSVHVLAFDEANDVAAEIVIWAYGEEIRYAALFPNGSTVNVAVDREGKIISHECDDCESAAAQIGPVEDLLANTEQAGWGKCAGYGVLLVAEIGTGHPIAAAATALLAACECYPLIFDDLEGKEC
jgi:hypothetical protein